MTTITLADFNTRQLLAAKRQMYSQMTEYRSEWEGPLTVELRKLVKGGACEILNVTYSVLFKELNTREHIPNKKEGKFLRQERVKQKPSRSRLHPSFKPVHAR